MPSDGCENQSFTSGSRSGARTIAGNRPGFDLQIPGGLVSFGGLHPVSKEESMSRFLVGIDGSDCGERALAVAREQALAADAELLVCYVINWSPFTFSTPQENAERHRRREEELSVARSKILEPRVRSLIDAGIEAEGIARHGHPARTLVQLAEEHDATMIVIGRAGDTPMKTRIFGGTAAALVQSAPCPVLVVP